MTFQIEETTEGLTRVTLTPPAPAPAPFDEPSVVYVLRGEEGDVTLINSGPEARHGDLLAALGALDVAPGAVERVVATAHRADLLGGAGRLPWADLFILAPQPWPDGWTPRDALDAEARRVEAAAEALRAQGMALDPQATADLRRVTTAPRPRPFIPLRDGHRLNLAGRLFRVLATPGASPGGMALHDPERGWLFAGPTVQASHEALWLRDPQAALQSLERLSALGVRRLMPDAGVSTPRPDWSLRHMTLFITNFLSNLPFALGEARSAPELAQRDLGITPEEAPITFIHAALGYQALCEELLRTGVIEADGEGLTRRYGSGRASSRVLLESAHAALFSRE